MALKDFYNALEDKYYAFMDGLQETGLKVYDYFINPVEEKGIPSFPVFVLFLVLLAGAVAFAVLSMSSPGALRVAVKVTADGADLDGVVVQLSAGDAVLRKTTQNGIANFEGVPSGESAVIRVEADGYQPFVKTFDLQPKDGADFVSVELQPAVDQSLYLFVSDDQGFPVGFADVQFTDPQSGELVSSQTDAQGKASLRFASASDIFNVRVSRDGYDAKTLSCFASQGACEAVLLANLPGNEVPPTNQPANKASVRVEVAD
ncbi:MAG: carboxypeptidase-like regulatory domain-containing protein, partial [Candidatus Micrarchaeota archaeon]|nr:carboxypeptidase-like regulatory domain-containing protein [Candidatus Micrarchaeota archaeon]